MTEPSIQDVLTGIEQPSRYLGSEINTIKKDHKNERIAGDLLHLSGLNYQYKYQHLVFRNKFQFCLNMIVA